MSIDAIAPSLMSSASAAQNPETLFKQLSSSLSAGDLSGAQAAFQSLQQMMQQSGKATNASDASSPFAALGQALQSGDLAGAQSAFAQMQQAHKGHHHHHHGGAQPTQTPAQAQTPAGTGGEVDLTI